MQTLSSIHEQQTTTNSNELRIWRGKQREYINEMMMVERLLMDVHLSMIMSMNKKAIAQGYAMRMEVGQEVKS